MKEINTSVSSPTKPFTDKTENQPKKEEKDVSSIAHDNQKNNNL